MKSMIAANPAVHPKTAAGTKRDRTEMTAAPDAAAPDAAAPAPPPAPKKPRCANNWQVAVRLMQHFASKLEPRHRRGLMRYAKVHKLMHDEQFTAFLDKHVDRTRPMDAGAVDQDLIPAMASHCKSMVRTLKAIKPADVEPLESQHNLRLEAKRWKTIPHPHPLEEKTTCSRTPAPL